MAQKRGITSVLGLALIFLCLMIHLDIAESAAYMVGDGRGWTYNVENWPTGKSFKAKDVLVFHYDPKLHNLVVVDSAGYNSCTAAPGSEVHQSGDDMAILVKGNNYFICSIPGHCQAGMKIAVNAV